MNILLTQHQKENWFPEFNYFRQYFNFKANLKSQFADIEQKANELGENNEFVIALQIIAVTAMIEASRMISNDDYREFLDEPESALNQSTQQLFELAKKIF